jgi:uncharacterized protein
MALLFAPVAAVCQDARAVPPSPEVAEALAQDYDPDPAVWLLADEDTRIYFLGTIHILPGGFRWRSPLLRRVIADADELVLETVEEGNEAADLGLIAEVLEQSKSRPPLSERVSPENRDKLEKLSAQMQLPAPLVDALPVWLLAFFIEASSQQAMGILEGEGVESQLTRDFQAAGKPISAIEDSADVIRAMSETDDSDMLKDFDDALTEWAGTTPFGLSTVGDDGEPLDLGDYLADDHDWAKGNAEALQRGLSPEELGQAFYQVLLVDRNRAWSNWIAARMDTPGTVLVAVGAGHFAGPDSLLLMLEGQGLAVRRVNPADSGD